MRNDDNPNHELAKLRPGYGRLSLSNSKLTLWRVSPLRPLLASRRRRIRRHDSRSGRSVRTRTAGFASPFWSGTRHLFGNVVEPLHVVGSNGVARSACAADSTAA